MFIHEVEPRMGLVGEHHIQQQDQLVITVVLSQEIQQLEDLRSQIQDQLNLHIVPPGVLTHEALCLALQDHQEQPDRLAAADLALDHQVEGHHHLVDHQDEEGKN